MRVVWIGGRVQPGSKLKWAEEWPCQIRPRRGRLKSGLYAVRDDRSMKLRSQEVSSTVWLVMG
ncbi:hypothetical protein RchiOBHm_Chr6g0283891 [Rosa chinensis]|uniref:Uncharacterized protein n=1 Tax=Rosa chinensis TaxID=74649 RepID=A0A2P6PU49_ROSCH|nr:hypothetical protein RchiOBHm_Chr6g0283891 [Rosa chinensis]